MLESFKRLRRAWHAAMLVGVLSGLAACTTAPIAANESLNGSEGAVVVKLITNGVTQSDPAESLSFLHLERVLAPGEKATGRDFASLVRTRDATRSTAVFSGMVRPGQYVISRATGGQGNMTYTFPLAQRLSRFEVRTGEVSLLGTVLIQPGMGLRFTVGYLPPDDELRQSFETLYPALAAQTRGRPVNTLERTPVLERSIAVAPAFRRLSSGWNGLNQTAEGDFFAGAKLGKVLLRKAGEPRWRELNTGSWREITWARPYRGGLLAVGEEGLIRFSRDAGTTWVSLAAPEQSLIVAAQPQSNGKVLALTRREKRWTAYLGEDIEQGGAWRKIGEFDESRSINVAWSQPRVVALPDNTLAVSMPEGTLYLVDQQSIAKVGSNQSTVDMAVAPDGTLVSQVMPMLRSTLVSKDRGKTWVDLNTSRFMLAIAFKDAQTAYAVSPIEPGMSAGKFGLMTSRDGGRTWSHTGDHPGLSVPYDVQQLLVDRTNGAVLAFLKDNAIVQSLDEGKTWKTVKDY